MKYNIKQIVICLSLLLALSVLPNVKAKDYIGKIFYMDENYDCPIGSKEADKNKFGGRIILNSSDYYKVGDIGGEA